MNTQDYISSGIIESYVLGLASDEERAEFESMCSLHPEVLQARTAFELSLEKQAFQHSVTPSADVKTKILTAIGNSGKVVSMKDAQPPQIRPAFGWLKFAAAACLFLLAGSMYMNIILSAKNKKLRESYNNTAEELSFIKKDLQTISGNPNIKMASMKGLDVSPRSYATVYWDTASHDVYLLTNNLPVPASDKQYQLWAIFNGQPVDLGVFDMKKERLLIQAKNAQGAEAFAITLEEKGGSPTPKGQMYVMGKL